MPRNTNVSQLGRDVLRLAYAGGSNVLLFWSYQDDTGSADGNATEFQMAMPWNGRVRTAYIFTTAAAGNTTVGVHINRNIAPLFTALVTPAAGTATAVRLQGEFSSGQELSFSVDPTNDPGLSYLAVGVQYDSPSV